jgi:hypothetical protein
VGIIINMMKVNLLILINYFPVVEKLDNGLNGRPFKLNGDIFIAKLIKINFSTSYSHIYLMIEVRFKIREY